MNMIMDEPTVYKYIKIYVRLQLLTGRSSEDQNANFNSFDHLLFLLFLCCRNAYIIPTLMLKKVIFLRKIVTVFKIKTCMLFQSFKDTFNINCYNFSN